LLQVFSPITSVGGMKPKINIEHEDEMWIAKFIEKGDPVFLPHAESAVLKMGRECGVATCASKVERVTDDCFAILVKRFDRKKIGDGYARLGFASAHTALRATPLSSMRDRSYLKLADEMKRWMSSDSLFDEKRELWRRVVFNALVGNSDDHLKNHGLLQHGKTWRLSPAFDIVPFQHKREHLALSMGFSLIDGKMNAVVSRDALLMNTAKFGYDKDEAESVLEGMAHTVSLGWREYMVNEGMPESVADTFKHSFSFADSLCVVQKIRQNKVDDCVSLIADEQIAIHKASLAPTIKPKPRKASI
jgi:serine/threonine-protein kinase HipA